MGNKLLQPTHPQAQAQAEPSFRSAGAGLIHYSRGKITAPDRPKPEARVCEHCGQAGARSLAFPDVIPNSMAVLTWSPS
jgi:hypothetical protein